MAPPSGERGAGSREQGSGALLQLRPSVTSPPVSPHGAKTANGHGEKRTFKYGPRSGNEFVTCD